MDYCFHIFFSINCLCSSEQDIAFDSRCRSRKCMGAYGTWFLQSKASDPAHAQRIQDVLMATLPAAAGVLVPPGYELGDEYEFMGYSSQEMNEFAFTALSRRLKVIGVGLPAVTACKVGA